MTTTVHLDLPPMAVAYTASCRKCSASQGGPLEGTSTLDLSIGLCWCDEPDWLVLVKVPGFDGFEWRRLVRDQWVLHT